MGDKGANGQSLLELDNIKHGTTGFEGNMYQIRLLTFFLVRATMRSLNFELRSEVGYAGKLDDVVFNYRSQDGKEEGILLQAKHRTGGLKTLSLDALLNDKDFSMIKYFNSYQDIRKHNLFHETTKVVVYTNRDFDEEVKRLYSKPAPKSEYDFLNLESFLNIPSTCGYYSFNESMLDKLKPQLDSDQLRQLAETLIKDILYKPAVRFQKGSIYKKYEGVLLRDVLDEADRSLFKFRCNFKNKENLQGETLKFHEILNKNLITKSYAFRKVLEKKKDDLHNRRVSKSQIKKIQSLISILEDKIINEETKFTVEDLSVFVEKIDLKISGVKKGIQLHSTRNWPKSVFSEREIKDYLDHLIYAVGQPNVSEFKTIIKEEIKPKFRSNLTNDFAVDHIQGKMIEWYTGDRKEGKYLNQEDGSEFINDVPFKILRIEYCRKLDSGVTFSPACIQDMKSFLSLSPDTFSCVVCSTDNPLTMMKIYQSLKEDRDKYLFLDIKSLLKQQEDRIYSLDTYKGLILECPLTCGSDIGDLTNLFNILRFFDIHVCILVDEVTNTVLSKIDYFEKFKKKSDVIKFSDLSDDSRKVLLEKPVNFLGERISLNRAMNGHVQDMERVIDPSILVQLMRGSEVEAGLPSVPLSQSEAAYFKIYEDVSLDNLKESLLERSSEHSCVYAMSDFDETDISEVSDALIQLLDIKGDDVCDVNSQIYIFDDIVRIDKKIVILQGSDRRGQSERFKRLCRDNAEKTTYWLSKRSRQFSLIQIYYPNFYFTRKLMCPKELIVQSSITNYIFNKVTYVVLSGSMDQVKKSLKITEENDREMFEKKMDLGMIVVCPENEAEQKFTEMSVSREVVQWLSAEPNGLMWRRSSGSGAMGPIRQHMDLPSSTYNTFEESDFVDQLAGQLVIFTGEPGTGKSTTLNSLARVSSPTNWTIRIDIKECADAIENVYDSNLNELVSLKTVLNFLYNVKNIGLDSDFAKRLFEYYLTTDNSLSRPVLLLMDGFDEINENLQKKMLPLLVWLKESSNATLWLTTRPDSAHTLEDALFAFSSSLIQFDPKEQKQYLKSSWETRFGLTLKREIENNPEKLQIYADCLIDKSSEMFAPGIARFIGMPLQLRLLSEGLETEVINFVNSERGQVLQLKKFNLLWLYEHFLESKNGIYLREKIQISSHHNYITSILINHLCKEHEHAALEFLFPHAVLKGNVADRYKALQKTENIQSVGIVQFSGSKKDIYFLHKTIAEYFCAKLLIRYIHSEQHNPTKHGRTILFLAEEMFKPSNEMLQKFIDHILAKDLPLHMEALSGEPRGWQGGVSLSGSGARDALGRSASHLAAQCRLALLSNLAVAGCVPDSSQTDHFGKLPLHYAVQNGNLAAAEYLLNQVADIDVNDHIFRNSLHLDKEVGNTLFDKSEFERSNLFNVVNKTDILKHTPLYYAGQKRQWDMASLLILFGANCSVLSEEQMKDLLVYAAELTHRAYGDQYHTLRPVVGFLALKVPHALWKLWKSYEYPRLLSYLCKRGHVKVIDRLFGNDFEKKKRILNNNDNSSFPLDRVNNSDSLPDRDHMLTIRYLLQSGANKCCNNISARESTLMSAAVRNHVITFDYIMRQSGDSMAINTSIMPNLNTYLWVSAQKNHLDMVKYMWTNYRYLTKDEYGNSALHAAADAGGLPSVVYLCENGAEANCTNDTGESPLHFAACRGWLDIVTYLVSKGAKVNAINRDELTPLDYALDDGISSEQDDNKLLTISYLITECGAVCKDRNVNIKDAKRIFRAKIADLNAPDSTLIHTAVETNQLAFVRYLLKLGANVNFPDKNGRSALSYAKSDEMIKLLLQHGAICEHASPRIYYRTDNKKIVQTIELIQRLFQSSQLYEDLQNHVLSENCAWIPDESASDNPMIFIIKAVNEHHETLLHRAAETDHRVLPIIHKFDQDYSSIITIVRNVKDYCPLNYSCPDSRGETPLHRAARAGITAAASLLLQYGAGFDILDRSDNTPEMLANQNGHKEIVQSIQDLSRLFTCVRENSICDVHELIAKGIELNARDSNGRSVLHLAALGGHSDMVELLLQNGVEVETADRLGETALHVAARQARVRIISLLMRHRAVYNPKNIDGKIPEDLFPQSVNAEVGNILKTVGAIFQFVNNFDMKSANECLSGLIGDKEIAEAVVNTCDYQRNTLLHHAARHNLVETVRILLRSGAAYDISNMKKEPPESLPSDSNIVKIFYHIQSLYENKSNITYIKSFQDEYNFTEAPHATSDDDEEMRKIITKVRNMRRETILHVTNNLYTLGFLLRRGADVRARDEDGRTALGTQALRGRVELVAALLTAGAGLQECAHSGDTPLHDAARFGHFQLVKFLLDRGAFALATNKDGLTPKELAREVGRVKMFKFLEKHEKSL